MNSDGLTSTANNGGDIAPIARRPGARKGMPRPAGAGRKKGTPNSATVEIKTVARKYGARAIAKAVRLLDSKDERVALAALREILDRAYGRPMETQELTGKDGAPLNPAPAVSDHELARLVTYQLTKGGRDMPTAPQAPAVASRREEIEAAHAAQSSHDLPPVADSNVIYMDTDGSFVSVDELGNTNSRFGGSGAHKPKVITKAHRP